MIFYAKECFFLVYYTTLLRNGVNILQGYSGWLKENNLLSLGDEMNREEVILSIKRA